MKEKTDDQKYPERITVDSTILVGKPVIRGTRLSVEFILGLLAHGMSSKEICAEYQSLNNEDILACLSFAAQAVGDFTFIDFDSNVA